MSFDLKREDDPQESSPQICSQPTESDGSTSDPEDEESLPESLLLGDPIVGALRELHSNALLQNVNVITDFVMRDSHQGHRAATRGKGKGKGKGEETDPLSSTTQSARLGAQSSGERQSSGHNKRTRGNGYEDNNGNEENDGQDGQKHDGTLTCLEMGEVSRRFACPFYKKDRDRYKDWRPCRGPGWKTVHRVK
jgi:hypothetical protein